MSCHWKVPVYYERLGPPLPSPSWSTALVTGGKQNNSSYRYLWLLTRQLVTVRTQKYLLLCHDNNLPPSVTYTFDVGVSCFSMTHGFIIGKIIAKYFHNPLMNERATLWTQKVCLYVMLLYIISCVTLTFNRQVRSLLLTSRLIPGMISTKLLNNLKITESRTQKCLHDMITFEKVWLLLSS